MNSRVDLDQAIGSLLERWYTRDIEPGRCRFCNEALDGWEDDPTEQYCDDTCEERMETVMNARIALGKRDLQQRGYD